MSRFEVIGTELDIENMNRHNRNFDRADRDLSTLQQQIGTEQQARIAAINNHIQAITAHAARAISLSAVSGMTSINVQAAIEELCNILTSIIAGPAPSAAEIQAARVGADNIARASLGILIREIHAKQLDAQNQQATLSRGVNVVNSDEASGATFKVQGRTLVNLLGRDGGFTEASSVSGIAKGWVRGANSGAYSLEISNGVGAQRISSLSTDTQQFGRRIERTGVKVDAGKFYIFIAYATVQNGRSLLRVDHSNGAIVEFGSILSGLLYVKFSPTTNADAWLRLYNSADHGTVGYVQFERARLYEVTAEEYAAIGTSIQGDAIDERWPYVDSIQPLQGLSVMVSGKNLLPPATQASGITGTWTIEAPYKAVLNRTASGQTLMFTLPCKASQVYTLSFAGPNILSTILAYNAAGQQTAIGATNSSNPRSFTTLVDTVSIRIDINANTNGTFTFENWMLVLGGPDNLPANFEPDNPQYTHLPVPLYSKLDGTVADSYDSATGQVFRRWQAGVKLDGALAWFLFPGGTGVGSKAVAISSAFSPTARTGSGTRTASKYDGTVFSESNEVSDMGIREAPADSINTTSQNLILKVSNSESGWIDGLNPSINAVKALMNGWRANGNNGTVYNSWVSILTGATPATNTEAFVAANKAPGWDCYATINYVLATPALEQLSGDLGAISVDKGANTVELIEGVVVRDRVKPVQYSGLWYINRVPGSELSKRASRILSVSDDKGLIAWTAGTLNAYGTATAHLPNYNGQGDVYVDYIVLDKYLYTSNAVDATLTYQSSQGSVLSQTVQDIASIKTHDGVQDWILAQHTARLLALEEA